METNCLEKRDSLKVNYLDWNSLYLSNDSIELPFNLNLKDKNKTLICEKIIRIVPKKRLLVFGFLDDKPVAIKMFFSKKSPKQDADNDAYGIETLINANIPTPKLIYKGTSIDGKIHILVFEKIVNGTSLKKIWDSREDMDYIEVLLRSTVVEIAIQHVLGVLQKDLHLDNFFITKNDILTMDGGKIKCFTKPLGKKTSIKYLSLFLVQLGIGFEKLQYELFDLYAKSRGWLVSDADIKLLHKSLLAETKRRAKKFKRKVFRCGSLFHKIKKFNKIIIYNKLYTTKNFINLLSNLDKYIDSDSALLLKKGSSSTVVKLTIDDNIFVLKRYNIKNLFHWLKINFRLSRAKKSWSISQQLYISGISVPKPVAYIENKILMISFKSYYISEYLDSTCSGEYFSIKTYDYAHKNLAILIFKLINNLRKLNITHGDLKQSNILVKNHIPYLVDFDGSSEHILAISLKEAFYKDWSRLMYNWSSQPEIKNLFKDYVNNNEAYSE
ncbi:hypothetical protein N9L02_03240, partial [Gammaproteobacteria bacterium]|nr:hypothetical protein [Gammaproteobacteria bacterium]